MVQRLDSTDLNAYNAFYYALSADFYSRNLKGKELAEFKYQRYMRDYAKVLKSLDDNVAVRSTIWRKPVCSTLRLVVYTSDQGFYMGEHGWFDKRYMYEESFLTPSSCTCRRD